MKTAAASLLGLFATAAWADAPAAAPGALAEVTVTATRHAQALLTFAGSATRIGPSAVARVRATHHAELLNRAPGAFVQRGSGQESLTALRSPVLTGAGSCGAFLFLEDGIPLRPVGFCNVNGLFEVNSEQAAAVEVLRGPGSALYGSNAVHGIVNVLSPLPEELPALGVSLEAGSDAYLRLRLATAGDARPGSAGAALHLTHDGGWRDASGFDEQKVSASFTQPAGAGLLVLRLNGSHLDQQTAGFVVGRDAYRDAAVARSNPDPEAYREAHSARLTAAWELPLDDGRLALRAALRTSRMEFLQHFLLGQPLERNGQESTTLLGSRTIRAGAGAELTFGLDAELASGFLLQRQDGPTTDGPPAANAIRPAGRHYDYVVGSRLVAPYLQWQWAPGGDRLGVSAGLRYESLRYDYDNRMVDGSTAEDGTPCPGAGCLYTRPADRHDRFDNLGPRLGVSWKLDATTALWAAASRGFRPPEATELYRLQRGQQLADLDSERADAVEAGLRHQGDGLTLELATYWMRKRDVILRDSLGFNVSGGRTLHRGLEYGLDWQVARRWRLGATGTWARHSYDFSGGIEQGEQVTRGDDVDTAPRHLHSLRLGYAAGSADIELEWLHVGSYWTNAANTARYPGHDLLNLRAGFRPGERVSLSLRATNLADTAYADRADYAFGNHRYFPGRGRAAFVEIGWQSD